VTELSKDVTHLITNALDSTGGLCTRTLKYMSTIVSRKPVVTFDCTRCELCMTALCLWSDHTVMLVSQG